MCVLFLSQLTQLCLRVTSSITHMERAVAIMHDSWSGAMKGLNDKMEALAKLIRDYGHDTQVQVQPANALCRVLLSWLSSWLLGWKFVAVAVM